MSVRALALFAGSDQIKEEIGRLCEVRGLGWLKEFNTHKNSLELIQLLEDWGCKLVAVASAAVGDLAPLEDSIEGVAAEGREDAVHKVAKQCIWITRRIGDKQTVCSLLDSYRPRRMSLWSALNLNRSDIIDMIMSHDPRVKAEELELAIALGRGNYDLARQLIGLEQPRGGGGVVVDTLAQFYGGSREVLASRYIAAGNLDLLRETTKDSMDSGRLIVMAVSVAAGSGLLEILQNRNSEIVDLLLRGRISGSVKDVERIIDAQRDPKAIEIFHCGFDATECDCGLLFKAIEGGHVEAAKVFVEMRHRVGNKEGEALGKQDQAELVVALLLLLDVRRLEIVLSKTARNSGRRGIVKQLLSEKHEEAEDEHQHLRRSKRERVVAKSQQSDKRQRQG
ncbi:hypothetical protein HK105_203034 [Polyrhizophydium stewartii]|uniref:Ankyrin repeat protein n=1 Tax=Polyrhizophydium stewartii TaxID=2732419 RepID=A0ABR4NCX7_9FUNG